MRIGAGLGESRVARSEENEEELWKTEACVEGCSWLKLKKEPGWEITKFRGSST